MAAEADELASTGVKVERRAPSPVAGSAIGLVPEKVPSSLTVTVEPLAAVDQVLAVDALLAASGLAPEKLPSLSTSSRVAPWPPGLRLCPLIMGLLWLIEKASPAPAPLPAPAPALRSRDGLRLRGLMRDRPLLLPLLLTMAALP